MQITRHFIDVRGARVHYRRCGSGPVLLMAHQSPRSSAEYVPPMQKWGAHFTCIAPDSPGFGQSARLPGGSDSDASGVGPDIDDFGDWVAALLDALGLGKVAAYGFHSGGIILMNALRRHPERFNALGVGGYAVWTPAEMALFADAYLPPFVPSAYGEHLTWLWHRVLEQSWFFPWFAADDAHRLSVAHDDVAKVDAVVQDFLDSGDAYRAGYGAVLRAPRGLPDADATMPPVLIAAYDGDPLQAHIDRLGALPAGWAGRKVATPGDLEDAMLDFLRGHLAPEPGALHEASDEGFRRVTTDAFDGLLHWRGNGDVVVPQPGGAVALMAGDAIDLPGSGLSDPWRGAPPEDWSAWQAVLDAAGGARLSPLPQGDPARLFPDLTPDRFGAYLTRAWSIVRARAVFDPWYAARAANAVPLGPDALDPARLARAHRALLQATSARAQMVARMGRN
ncbi:alpha/beta fold hydrolase [Glacieibacterium frigidum]|uniref:Alpha/beta fold hydrolase n=1 Tax=Glacieibacterium frigidum TaxID=2593303 RepID=A0A552UJK1_9SPHN|nr:alpha/beta fold hydrolase [Glacieibacterium frigidum]